MRDGHHVFPGEVFVTREDLTISTLLGSCVSVLLTDESTKVSGMNHYLLPFTNKDFTDGPYRYGDQAIRELYRQVIAKGANPTFLRARLYGGANVIPIAMGGLIGEQNAKVALDFLSSKGIPILEQALGGTQGRSVHFQTGSGKVTVTLHASQNPDGFNAK